MAATVSLCMIVRNEERHLHRCLSSVADLVDEIVIVDTGSTDGTKTVAAGFTDLVRDFVWVDDFSAARNFAFSLASMDFQMWLDADDFLKPEDRELFRQTKETLSPDTDVVRARYNVAFDNAGNCTMTYFRERLLRRATGFRWQGRVHECITPSGKIEHAGFAVTHGRDTPGDPARNLRIYGLMRDAGEAFSPRDTYYYARELYYHKRYREAAEGIAVFLDQGGGWIEDLVSACGIMALCYYALGDPGSALRAYLRSLEFGRPRSEICCNIGQHFLDRERWETAAYWYETALVVAPYERDGFLNPDCHGYRPYIQLCVCHDRLGNRERARHFNEMAGRLKPQDAAVLANRTYFENLERQGLLPPGKK